jgi:hypothetical protein
MLFKNSVRTSKRTQHFTITKINWLMLFKEIISVYSENHKKPTKSNSVGRAQSYGLLTRQARIVTAVMCGRLKIKL